MNKFGIIATWYMAYDGIEKGYKILQNNGESKDAIVEAIKDVEDNPKYKSVGYGGLPNEECVVELDAAFMDGKTFDIGCIAGVHDVKNPIEVAEELSHSQFNVFLVGQGADNYIKNKEFTAYPMLSEKAKEEYNNKLEQMKNSELTAYDGHDTVGMVCLDTSGDMTSATSTSGLFMKKPGRVGDSPVIGSGLYVDNEIGGCASTGLGEDIMKGCLSYDVVKKMEQGMSPQEACEEAMFYFIKKLEKKRGKASAMSIVAMNNEGEWGVATNIEFTFVVANHKQKPTIYVANLVDNKIKIDPVSDTSKWQATEEHK